MIFSKWVLIIGGFIYLSFGFLFFINPHAITAMDGIELPDAAAANHIRAVLGGMEIGLGALLLLFARSKKSIPYGLLVLAISIGITSLTRLYGIIFTGAGDMSNNISFLFEFGFAAMAMAAYWKLSNKDSSINKHR